MDQDVEAILNASDSEEDDSLDVQGVSLEDILREDDGAYMDDELLHDASDDNPPHLRGAGQDHELDRWRTGDGLADGGSPRLHRGRKSADEDRSPLPYRDGTGGGFDGEAGSGGWGGDDLSPGSFAGDDDDDDKERLSEIFSGDSYEDGGAPPRTAFLNQDQVSEDSRLLQQILKESEEEMAAATEDRAANAGFGGSHTMAKVVGGAGGAGGGGGSYGGGGYRGYGDAGAEHDGANLQSLDVDRIIESMEQEVGEEGGSRGRSAGGGMPSWPAAAGASASRRRSFTTDVSGSGSGGGGSGGGIAGADYDAVSRPRDRGASLGGSSTAAAQGLGVDRGSGSHSTLDTQGVAVPQGGPGDALAVDPSAGGGAGGLGSLRARRTSDGGRSGGVLLPSAVTGDVKGVSGGGDWGLTGAMRKAEAGELRLLRGGNREIISPLQVKRRMRAPPPPPPAGQPSPGFPGIGGGVGGGVGVVRMENLEAASRQLARNAAYGKHGPGVCTATAAHSKFIAVGTSRGLILLFDHFQEIRHVLGSAGGGGADGVPADDPVTSLDMCVASDCLLAGHESGRILLWDYLRGVVLKAVVDLHSSAVVSVRCFVQGGGGGEGGGGGGSGGGSSDPAAITADVEGVVNKLCFRRVMWTKWVVDTECLLDGAAGPIPALCVLPSWTDSAASTSGTATAGGGRKNGAISGVSPGFHDIGMMAMSSWKNTFIVGIYPEVKVVHKWPRPPLGAGGTDHLPPPCLSWGPPQPSAARARAPPMALLARGWGNSIQILAATRVDMSSGGRGGGGRGGRGGAGPRGGWREGGGAGGGAGVRWPSLAVVKELSASAPVVAVEWLREQVLAYLDTDMELCVLDTRAGTELEHASLSTLGVSISPIIPQPNSSQATSSLAGFSAGGTKDNAGGNPRKQGGEERAELAPTPPPAPAPPGTYHNAFRACEGRLYLLGRQELRAVRVQGWSQRVESLVQAGEWLEALAVALDHFEQKILPAENAAAAAAAEAAAATAAVLATSEGGAEATAWTGGSFTHGGGGGGQGMNSAGDRDTWGRDGGGFGGERSMVGAAALGSRVPGDQLLLQQQQQQPQRRPAPRSEAAEHISDLLAQYLRLAMNNAPAAESSSAPGLAPPLSSGGGSRINLAHSHFQMLAGVCLEYCAVTGRLDMLFGQVFNAFRARGQQGVFLDTLEPYVLMGKLKTLSPETLGAFLDRCQSGGDMIAAERLVLRLEPRALDLASALPLLRRHRLFSALLAVRASRGDYTSSVDEVLREAMSIAERDRPHAALSSSGNGPGGGADPSSCSPTSAERAPGDGGAELRPYPADPTFDELGHKVLLYLTRCFRGRMLGGSEPLSDGETAKARANLLHLLVQPSLSSATALTSTVGREGRPAKHASSAENLPSPSPWKGAVFPYLSILLYVDAGAAIDVLSIAMDSPDAVFRETGDTTIPSPISPASAVPTSFRQSATVPRGRGRESGDDIAQGRGGVWGKRIGKGRARAIGWAGAPAPAASGAGAEGGGVGAEGWTERGVGGKSAEVVENVCPSRRTIVEAVTSVLAPNLSGQADRAMEAMMMATGSPFPGSGGGNSPQDHVGLSAGAFVHSPRGGLSSGTGDGLRDGSNGNGGGGADDRSGAAWHESPSSRLRDRDGQEWWSAARPRLFDFVAKYLELSLVSVGPRLTNAVLVGVAKEVGGGGAAAAASGQARLVTLLQRVPLSLVDRATLLPLAEKSRFFRAAVILLKAAVTLGEQKGFTLEEFARIVRCYLQDSEDTFRMQVFAFIRQEVARSTSATPPKSRTSPSQEGSPSAPGGGRGNKEDRADGEGAELLEKRDVVLTELPRLMELNKAEAVFTIGEAFRGDHKAALDALSSTTTLQFEYLDALLRPSQGSPSAASLSQGAETDGDKKLRGGRRWGGTSPEGGVSGRPSRAPPALAAGLDERDRSLHIRLLVKFRPYEVYPFLSGSTGYSLDDTLALCQERGVADATAYLLERKGDVPGALALALRTLSARLASLRSALQAASLRDVAAEMAFVVPGSPSKRPPTGEDGARPVIAKSLSGSGLGGFGAVAGGGSGGAPRAGTAAWARWASKVALEGLQEGREAIRSLMVAIEMCQRASPATGATVGPTSLRPPGARNRATNGPGSAGGEARSRASTDPFDDDGDLDLSASLWFQTLDKILSAKGAACRSDPNTASAAGARGGVGVPGERGGLAGRGRAASRAATAATAGGELPQTAAVMGGVLDALLQRTLSSMAGYVPLPAIVKKVVSDHAGSSLGEFRHVILAMLDTYSYDTAIHRTAASLLFDSLRTVVRERHTLKGAGVRVSAVAGLELNPARDAECFGATPPAKNADSADFRGGGTRTPPPPTLPPGLLDAVGSGVISVSPSGQALVEHLGQGGAGSGGREDGAGSGGGGGGGGSGIAGSWPSHDQPGGRGGSGGVVSTAGVTAIERRGASKQEASASLWRLRAARRRRQARGDKMRSLVTWAAGDEGPAWNASPGGGGGGAGGMHGSGERGGGRGRGAAAPSPRGRFVGRSGGIDGESGASRTPGTAAKSSTGGSAQQASEAEQGQQAVGWGVALQARARAIPASFMPKRT